MLFQADVQVRTIPCRDCLVQRNVFEEKYKPYFRNVNPTSIITKFQSRSDPNQYHAASFSSFQPSIKHSSLEPVNSHFGSKPTTELYADDQFSSFNETQNYHSNMNMTISEETNSTKTYKEEVESYPSATILHLLKSFPKIPGLFTQDLSSNGNTDNETVFHNNVFDNNSFEYELFK